MSGPRRRPTNARQGRRRPAPNARAFWGAEPDAATGVEPDAATGPEPDVTTGVEPDAGASAAPHSVPAPPRIVLSGDATAMVRSLGPAPLPGRETVAEHYFAAVYERAAAVAAALAAASGLLDTDTDAESEPTE